jgi:hypothetical protein
MSLSMSQLLRQAAPSHGNPAFAALIWWVVPLVAVIGAIIYVLWVSRFKDKFENETNRSVTTFQSFQRSFDGPPNLQSSVKPVPPSPQWPTIPSSDSEGPKENPPA